MGESLPKLFLNEERKIIETNISRSSVYTMGEAERPNQLYLS